MLPYIIAMIVILGLAAAVVGMVVLGIEGRGKSLAPRLADRMARAAQHLNGDGEVPAKVTQRVTRLMAARTR